jgi:hypothetical protein
VVQVGAFGDPSAAREVRLKVEKLGLKTYTQVVEVEGSKRTRVRVGPYERREEAQKVAERLKAAGLTTSTVLALCRARRRPGWTRRWPPTLLLCAAVGLRRGLVPELFALLGCFVAFFAAGWAAPPLAAVLPVGTPGGALNHAAALVLAFLPACWRGGCWRGCRRCCCAATPRAPRARARRPSSGPSAASCCCWRWPRRWS